MPPKKREKDGDSSKNHRMDQNQADHELFLQAFEKPTQIYRFLRTRNMLSPVFLYRTLSYMRQRMSRSHKKRREFKVDSLLEKVLRNQNSGGQQPLSGYMTLTFLGFYDKKIEGDCHEELVKVETLLLKICHKKRKDVSCPVMTVSLGTSFVPYNPSEDYPPPKAPAVSIPTESFSLSNGHLVKSYHLLLRVGMCSSNVFNSKADIDSEPPQKKKKSIKVAGEENGDWHQFGTDLIIYDKQNRCLLSDGDYELLLEELSTNTSGAKISHGLSSWEYIGQIKEEPGDHLTSFEKFSSGPTLKFRLRWSRDPVTSLVDRPKPTGTADEPLDNNSNKENNRPDRIGKVKMGTMSSSTSKLQIVYQFLYNNNSRQQTEACEDLHCPWCSLDCNSLYSLLKHLKLCHSRFTFTYVPIPQGARIDVALNDHYDGSYTGSPQDLISQPGSGLAFSRNGPVRRTSVSNILVCHPKRPRPSLSEFLELDENEFDGQRPYVTGHNRLYHHTTTCLPVHAKEMDIDSEDENDPKWLQTKTMMMIDEFTDVNEGEKELMKMWNLHVMRHGYVGDCQIPLASNMFLQARGKDLLLKNLYRNFVLHMCNLFDFGLISPVTVYMTIQKLQELIGTDGDESKVLQESCAAQRQHWLQEGANKSTADIRRIPASPAAGPAERRKPATNFTPQPSKTEKVIQRIYHAASPPAENVSKKRTSEQPEKRTLEQAVRNGDASDIAAKKKSLGGIKSGVAEKKKTLVKTENAIKKKLSLPAESTTSKSTAQQGETKGTNSKTAPPSEVKDIASKLRRKSSTASLRETATAAPEPIVVLRRKSFAGATDVLRKKAIENGVSNVLPNLLPSESRRKDGGGSTPNKTNNVS